MDWLSFNSGCNTATTVTAKHISGSSMEIQVFNADGTKVDGSFYINGYGKKSQTVLLDSNTTYYVKVCASVYNSAYYGKYKISVSGRQDEPGKRKDGQKIKCKKTLNGTLDANGDIDWYKIKLNKNRKWKFTFKNVSDSTMTFSVYKGGKLIKKQDVYSCKKDKLKLNLKKGTYYIKVEGAVGDYSIKVNK